MSMPCTECDRIMRPSSELPGREGTEVHPVALAFIWNPDQESDQRWILQHVLLNWRIPLCLDCINWAIPEERKTFLDEVFEAYLTEMDYRNMCQGQEKRMMKLEELAVRNRFREIMDEKQKVIDHKKCLICGTAAHEQQKPVFKPSLLDRVRSYFGELIKSPNYQWNGSVLSSTSFSICFDCFAKHFPKTYSQLGCDLLGKPNPDIQPIAFPLITMTPEFYEALKQEVGEAKAEEIVLRMRASIRPKEVEQ